MEGNRSTLALDVLTAYPRFRFEIGAISYNRMDKLASALWRL
jgi:hypothetical protein